MSLITKSDLVANKGLSQSTLDALVQPSIFHACNIDLPKLIGLELFADLQANPTSTTNGDYPLLLNGGTYTYAGRTYYHVGLKSIIMDFCMAHYNQMSKEVDTPFGQNTHTYANGSPITDGRVNVKYRAYRDAAMEGWEQVELFLQRSNEYTFWRYEQANTAAQISPIQIKTATIL